MTEVSDFRARCAEAAREFIRTVLVVDDHSAATITPSPDDRRAMAPSMAGRPRVGESSDDDQVADSEAALKSTERHSSADALTEGPDLPKASLSSDHEVSVEDDSHALYGDVLQRAFADESVVCSVFFENKPDGDAVAPFFERVFKVAVHSDVLILDWSWNGDHGDFCTEMIRALCVSDLRRRQLILIYTGETDSEVFRRKLALIDGFEAKRLPVDVEAKDFCFCWPNFGLSVQVVQKPRTRGEVDFYSNSRVAENELPARVFDIFGQHYGGLLANAAMCGLGRLRDETHRVLVRFRSALDAPYVIHRSFTEPRSGAEEQVRDLIADSIADALDSPKVTSYVRDGDVRLWLSSRPESEGLASRLSSFGAVADWSEAIVEGLSSAPGLIRSQMEKPDALRGVTKGLSEHSDVDALIDEFSLFVYSETGRRDEGGRLSSGAVVFDRSSELYLLCMMPACDAERVDGKCHFPFLAMTPGAKKNSRNVVLTHNGKVLGFYVEARMRDLRSIEFENRGTVGPVRSAQGVFRDSGAGEYEYVGRLRTHVTTDIAQALGASGTRVGIMASEFARRAKQ